MSLALLAYSDAGFLRNKFVTRGDCGLLFEVGHSVRTLGRRRQIQSRIGQTHVVTDTFCICMQLAAASYCKIRILFLPFPSQVERIEEGGGSEMKNKFSESEIEISKLSHRRNMVGMRCLYCAVNIVGIFCCCCVEIAASILLLQFSHHFHLGDGRTHMDDGRWK